MREVPGSNPRRAQRHFLSDSAKIQEDVCQVSRYIFLVVIFTVHLFLLHFSSLSRLRSKIFLAVGSPRDSKSWRRRYHSNVHSTQSHSSSNRRKSSKRKRFHQFISALLKYICRLKVVDYRHRQDLISFSSLFGCSSPLEIRFLIRERGKTKNLLI